MSSTASAPCPRATNSWTGIDHEVLAQHRHVDRVGDVRQVGERAAEALRLGEHADRRRPAVLVVERLLGRLALRRDRPGARRRLLDLGDHRDVEALGERGGEVADRPRAAGEPLAVGGRQPSRTRPRCAPCAARPCRRGSSRGRLLARCRPPPPQPAPAASTPRRACRARPSARPESMALAGQRDALGEIGRLAGRHAARAPRSAARRRGAARARRRGSRARSARSPRRSPPAMSASVPRAMPTCSGATS